MRGIPTGLHAALLLARGRAEAIGLLAEGDAIAAARRSFWAAALCVPAFVCLRLLDWQQSGGAPASARGFAGDLLGFVVGWAGFALITHELAKGLNREAAWPRFITLWNWCNLVQYLMLVAAALPGLLGVPDIVGQTAWLVAMGWALWLEWFMTRLALSVPGPVAAGMVAMDLALGLFIAGFTGSLS